MVNTVGDSNTLYSSLALDTWYWLSFAINLTSDQGQFGVWDANGTPLYNSGVVSQAYTNTDAIRTRVGAVLSSRPYGVGLIDEYRWIPGVFTLINPIT